MRDVQAQKNLQSRRHWRFFNEWEVEKEGTPAIREIPLEFSPLHSVNSGNDGKNFLRCAPQIQGMTGNDGLSIHIIAIPQSYYRDHPIAGSSG